MRIFIADSDGGYRRPSRILGRFVDDLITLTGSRGAVRVQWPAPGKSTPRRSHTWESAAAAGVADLNRLVRLHPSDHMILVGCCCGCRVIQNWLEENPESVDRVAAVGMVADPFRPHDRWLEGMDDPGGQGVAGERPGPIPDRTHWVSIPGDPLSSVNQDSLLRAPVRSSTLTPDQVFQDLLDSDIGSRTRLASRLHVFSHPSQWSTHMLRRLDEARETLERFESGEIAERYASAADGPSPLERLAAVLAAEAPGEGGAPGEGRAAGSTLPLRRDLAV